MDFIFETVIAVVGSLIALYMILRSPGDLDVKMDLLAGKFRIKKKKQTE